MTDPTERAKRLTEAMNKATAQITDPTKRAEAKALLETTRRELLDHNKYRRAPAKRRETDRDFER